MCSIVNNLFVMKNLTVFFCYDMLMVGSWIYALNIEIVICEKCIFLYCFRDEEAMYVRFMRDVTNEVLDRGIYTDR